LNGQGRVHIVGIDFVEREVKPTGQFQATPGQREESDDGRGPSVGRIRERPRQALLTRGRGVLAEYRHHVRRQCLSADERHHRHGQQYQWNYSSERVEGGGCG